jgi:hypothetical protein
MMRGSANKSSNIRFRCSAFSAVDRGYGTWGRAGVASCEGMLFEVGSG